MPIGFPFQPTLHEQIAQRNVTVVLDCTDNFATRHAVNRACVAARVPLVSGAVIRFDGQVSVFDPRTGTQPCYCCLFPQEQQFTDEACSTMGVFAPLVGVVGAMQAAEALKLVMGAGQSLAGRLLLLDGLHMEWSDGGRQFYRRKTGAQRVRRLRRFRGLS